MPPTIAIIGAGFSGIATAIQLLRQLEGPAHVCLVNRNHRFGRGMAYGTRSESHLLNVPAGRMSASAEDEGEFVRYLQAQGLPWRANDFVPRKLYGDYLEATLERAQAQAAHDVTLQLVQGEAASLAKSAEAPATLHLQDGRVLRASEVILALGNFAPRPPCAGSPVWAGRAAVIDPWSPVAYEGIARDASVLLTGTGLTAYDVVLALLDRGHTGLITMLSRRGLLPHAHRVLDHAPAAGLVPEEALAGVNTARGLLRAIRTLVRAASGAGHDWRDVIGGLRGHTPRLWAQLEERGRRQFLRHLLPYWETHRHRAAPAIHRRIEAAIDDGRVRVVAARIEALAVQADGRVRVSWRERGLAACKQSCFDALVNCTGPCGDVRRAPDALIQRMLADGDLRADTLGLGLEVDADYRVLRANGEPLPHVRYVGPLLKAQLWEATAVPELRQHAARVAGAAAAAWHPGGHKQMTKQSNDQPVATRA